MADVINFNKKRKAKNRLDKEKKAAINRVKFGRTKQEKQVAKQKNHREEKHLDGHKLEENNTSYAPPGTCSEEETDSNINSV